MKKTVGLTDKFKCVHNVVVTFEKDDDTNALIIFYVRQQLC